MRSQGTAVLAVLKPAAYSARHAVLTLVQQSVPGCLYVIVRTEQPGFGWSVLLMH